jgi:hypothetical protein
VKIAQPFKAGLMANEANESRRDGRKSRGQVAASFVPEGTFSDTNRKPSAKALGYFQKQNRRILRDVKPTVDDIYSTTHRMRSRDYAMCA